MKRKVSWFVLLSPFLILVTFSVSSNAQEFTIADSDTVVVTQNLDADGSIGQIEDGGALRTNGDSILSSGIDVQLLNYGEIETWGVYSVSFTTSGNDTTVFNAGSGISDGAFLVSSGTGLIFENTGYLESTQGQYTSGGFPLSLGYTIYSTGSNATVLNAGEIRALGSPPDVIAILSEGDDATLTNSFKGLINSDGAGIVTRGNNAHVENDGYIETQANKIDFTGFPGGLNAPIHSSGSNVRIFNTGNLVASGISSDGIYSDGFAAKIINSGRIEAGVPFRGIDDPSIGNGTGLFSAGASAVIVNSGAITQVQIGIDSSGDNSRIVNEGLIEFSGYSDRVFGIDMPGYGILSSGEGVEIVHNGIILGKDIYTEVLIDPAPPKSRVTNGIGIDPFGTANGTADISGKIVVSSMAILGGNGDQVVTLRDGAQITGAIDLGGGTDTVNIEMAGSSSSLRFLNVENINLSPGVDGVVSGDSVHVVDPSIFSFQTQTLNSLVSRAHGSMLRRSQFEDAANPFWIEASAMGFDFDGDRKMRGYEHTAYFFNLGYQFDLDSGQAGFIAGYSEGDVKSDQVAFQDAIQSVYFGGYFRFRFHKINLSTSLLVGREEHEQQRFVLNNMSGYEKAEARPDNYFISPSLSINTVFPLTERFSLVPSGTLSYTLSYIDSYRESGAASNLSVDERVLHIGNLQAELAAIYRLKLISFAFVGGGNTRYSNDSSVKASIAGQALSIDPVNDQTMTSGFLAARVGINLSENLSVSGVLENRFYEDGDEVFGGARLAWSF